MPDTDAFTDSPFAYATPAGRLRCGPEAVASALLLAGDRRFGEIATSNKAELDIAGLSAALTRDLQPHWQAANSRVAEGLQLA